MQRFIMTIGDWSGDGHGKSEDFTVESNLPIERVREAHFQIEKVTGVNIENICSGLGEDEIEPDTVAAIKKLGFQFENSTEMGEEVIGPREMALLWMFLLMKAEDKLRLKLVEETLPSLHFYGFDAQNRHIGFVGYGLFGE